MYEIYLGVNCANFVIFDRAEMRVSGNFGIKRLRGLSLLMILIIMAYFKARSTMFISQQTLHFQMRSGEVGENVYDL